jgi:hypothetical protein
MTQRFLRVRFRGSQSPGTEYLIAFTGSLGVRQWDTALEAAITWPPAAAGPRAMLRRVFEFINTGIVGAFSGFPRI